MCVCGIAARANDSSLTPAAAGEEKNPHNRQS